MHPTSSLHEACRVQFSSFTPFLLISFGLAWSIIGLYILLPDLMGTVFGQLTGNHPLFFLAVYAPAIAAFILVARKGGFGGLRRFLGRALLWRCSVLWYVFLIMRQPFFVSLSKRNATAMVFIVLSGQNVRSSSRIHRTFCV